jgi:hypothetical protein
MDFYVVVERLTCGAFRCSKMDKWGERLLEHFDGTLEECLGRAKRWLEG